MSSRPRRSYSRLLQVTTNELDAPRRPLACNALHLLFVLLLGLTAGHCAAQDAPAPQPKPKAATPSPKPKATKPTVTPQQSTNNLVVRADVDCHVSVDGGDPVVILAGKAHKFPSGPGQHLVQAESLDGTAKNEQSVDQKEPQVVVEVNLSAVLAKHAEEQVKATEAAEVRRKTIASLGNFAGRWLAHFQEDESNIEGVYTYNDQSHNGTHGSRHQEVTWNMTLSHEGDAIAGYLYRTIRLSLIPTPHGKLYDSFTWNGAQVSTATYTLSYKIDGVPQPDGNVLFGATYERCSGACGDIDNDPRSQDFKAGTAEMLGSEELDWTSKDFDPQTKVFRRQ